MQGGSPVCNKTLPRQVGFKTSIRIAIDRYGGNLTEVVRYFITLRHLVPTMLRIDHISKLIKRKTPASTSGSRLRTKCHVVIGYMLNAMDSHGYRYPFSK